MYEKYLYGSEGGAGHDRPYPYTRPSIKMLRRHLLSARPGGAKRKPDRAQPQ